MQALFDTASYEWSVLSLPFIAAVLVVVASAANLVITAGAPLLRASMMIVVCSLFPFVAGCALAASTVDPAAATMLFRVGNATLPLAAAGALMFLLTLAGTLPRYRWLVAIAITTGLIAIPITIATDAVVVGVWMTPSGMYWYESQVNGIAQLQPLLVALWVGLGVFMTWNHQRNEASGTRRRQLRGAMLAFSLCAFGLVDSPLAYGYGWFPLSWVFLTLGVSVALRLMIVADLVHSRELDRRMPLALLFIATACAGVWLMGHVAGADGSPFILAGLVAVLFTVLRLLLGLAGAVGAPVVTRADTTLDRALERYGKRVATLRDRAQISEATIEVVELGVGTESVELLMPRRDDYSWETSAGEVLPEDTTPDPLLLVWMEQNARPLARDELATMRLGELRAPVERLFDSHQAEVLVPLVNRDEIVGLLCLGGLPGGHAYRQDELRFLARIQEQAASALVYARMHLDATERVEVDKDVGLAAAVQQAFVPGSHRIERSGVVVAGSYQPASKCGGDWWSVHQVPDGKVLVLIGDVTGHGIAAAMVTAAAKGCYDVAQRLMGERVDLVQLLELLDAAVKRAGGKHFYMTCFATLIDAEAGSVRYANAGHVVPYVCRSTDNGMDLDVLVARGDPLGAGGATKYVEHERPVEPGDLLIWYTDGLVECSNTRRQQFGDRRMQRMLKRLKAGTTDVVAVRDLVVRTAAAFQEGQPPDDDITLVVGRVGVAAGASGR